MRIVLREVIDQEGDWLVASNLPKAVRRKFMKMQGEYWISRTRWRKIRKLVKKTFKVRVELSERSVSLGTLLEDVGTKNTPRYKTQLEMFDKLLDGGFAKGTLVVVGGEPGIGKSTLCLQLVLQFCEQEIPVLYVTSEETSKQIVRRARRLVGELSENQKKYLRLLSSSDYYVIRRRLWQSKAKVVVIDSLGMIRNSVDGWKTGGIRALQAVGNTAKEWLREKRQDGLGLLIGHVNKFGRLAGPKSLEHLVDTSMMFHGDAGKKQRIIHPEKNRYGPTFASLVVEMTPTGLSFTKSKVKEHGVVSKKEKEDEEG